MENIDIGAPAVKQTLHLDALAQGERRPYCFVTSFKQMISELTGVAGASGIQNASFHALKLLTRMQAYTRKFAPDIILFSKARPSVECQSLFQTSLHVAQDDSFILCIAGLLGLTNY